MGMEQSESFGISNLQQLFPMEEEEEKDPVDHICCSDDNDDFGSIQIVSSTVQKFQNAGNDLDEYHDTSTDSAILECRFHWNLHR